MLNSIIWGNTAGLSDNAINGGASISYSNVQNAVVDSEKHVLSTDPLFVNPAGGDLRLQPTSPCIDAAFGDGAPSYDIDGKPRVDATGVANSGQGKPAYVDMGAYEYQP